MEPIGALLMATSALLEAPHRVHLDDVIIWGPNGTSKSATMGFNAHPGAQVSVDLKIVAPQLQRSGLKQRQSYSMVKTDCKAVSGN